MRCSTELVLKSRLFCLLIEEGTRRLLCVQNVVTPNSVRIAVLR